MDKCGAEVHTHGTPRKYQNNGVLLEILEKLNSKLFEIWEGNLGQMKWSFLSHFSFDGGAWNHAALRVEKKSLGKYFIALFCFWGKSDLRQENSDWTIQIVSGESSFCDAVIRVTSRFLWPADHTFFFKHWTSISCTPPPPCGSSVCVHHKRGLCGWYPILVYCPQALFSHPTSQYSPPQESSTQQYCICVSYTSCWMLCVFRTTGCWLPPPLPLAAAKAGYLHMNKYKTPLLPTGIRERYSQTISILWLVAPLRRCVWNDELTRSAVYITHYYGKISAQQPWTQISEVEVIPFFEYLFSCCL